MITAKINRMPIHKLRYILGATLGAIYSFFIFVPPLNTFLSILIKCAFSVSIVFLSFGRQNKKTFFRLLSVFFASTFALGGIMISTYLIFKPKNMILSNGVIYFNISSSMMILLTVAFYIIFEVISKLTKHHAKKDIYCKAEILTEMGSILINAIIDSGNTLCDLFTDSPVVVVDYNNISAIIPKDCREAFKEASLDYSKKLTKDWATNYRLIPYNCIKGTGLLPAFKPKAFYIYHENKCIRVKDVLIAVNGEMAEDEKAIINPRVFELSEIEGSKCLKK
jgi:stage II sporulation protein GA (sporulation sigma-E factor processing peptidase)